MAERPAPEDEKYLPLIAGFMQQAAAMSREELEHLVVTAAVDSLRRMDQLGPEDALLAAEQMVRITETLNRIRAREGGRASHQKDAKRAAVQRAKTEARAFWVKWQSERDLYESKADFARTMLDKFEALTSQKKIEDWTRDWEKEIRKKR